MAILMTDGVAFWGMRRFTFERLTAEAEAIMIERMIGRKSDVRALVTYASGDIELVCRPTLNARISTCMALTLSALRMISCGPEIVMTAIDGDEPLAIVADLAFLPLTRRLEERELQPMPIDMDALRVAIEVNAERITL